MFSYNYITLRQRPELTDVAAEWFCSKWKVPKEAYLECMNAYLKKETELGWYLCMDGEKIVGGAILRCKQRKYLEKDLFCCENHS